MTEVLNIVRTLVGQMQVREVKSWTSPDEEAIHYREHMSTIAQAQVLARAALGNEKVVLDVILDAFDMQNKRESGEFHILPEPALAIWNEAKVAGEAYILSKVGESYGYTTHPGFLAAGLEAAAAAKVAHAAKFASAVLPEAKAVSYLKQRAETMKRGLEQFGVQVKHGQALRVVAAMEGHKSFASLREKLDRTAPNFCPHCGAAGTLQSVGSVYCEQGEYEGNSYEAEGDGTQYACTRCSGQFNDWVGR